MNKVIWGIDRMWSNKQYAVKCLESGKIPYIEKPIAQTFEECLL